MEPTKEEIKAWVDTPGRGRAWLAEQCGGVSPRTVNNWLTADIAIPAKALRIIEALMRSDEARKGTDLSQVVLRITTEELNEWSRAFKASDADTLEDWALGVIRAAYETDQTGSSAALNPVESGEGKACRPTPSTSGGADPASLGDCSPGGSESDVA